MSAKVQGQSKKEKGFTSCLQHFHKVWKVYRKVYWEDQNKLVDNVFVSTEAHEVISSKTEVKVKKDSYMKDKPNFISRMHEASFLNLIIIRKNGKSN